MKVATALVSGGRPHPELAQEAVRAAMAEAGLARADGIILFLSREFARHPQPAVLAAARVGACLAVGGCTASGMFTERGWQLEQPTAAALVYGAPASTAPGESPTLSFSGHSRLPFDWQDGTPRAGLIDSDAATWAHGRITSSGCAEIRLPGLNARLLRANGLRLLGDPLPVTRCHGYELACVGPHRAIDSLQRALPPEWREHPPWHQISVLRQPDEPGVAILSVNGDGSLMLAEPLDEGETIRWAIRQPLAAEQQMRETLNAAAAETMVTPTVDGKKPAKFALMFSCIGRGPLFYGKDDRDLQAFREAFPGTPLLGAYGTGQIAPLAGHNRLFHNTALTLLFESAHV